MYFNDTRKTISQVRTLLFDLDMDYEKAYKAALQTAKQWIKDGCTDKEKICLECVFPELRESEDERMLREFNDWLCEEIECRTNDLRDEKDRRTLNMLCYILTKVKDWLEKQEQKPYGQRDECKDCQVNYAGSCKGTCEMRQKEQKPAWSEEDENTINLIIAILRENHPNDIFKTNPVNTICMSAISTDMLIKRIESLRPSWKPSEEQMQDLEGTIKYYGSQVPEGLKSLYEQLKKL